MQNYKAHQAFVFASSFACMAARHSAISGFYMVKPYIQRSLGFESLELGLMDTSYLLSYAIGNCISGNLGDKYSLKKLVCYGLYLCSLTYMIVLYIQIVLLSYLKVTSPFPYYLLFFLNGLFQSTVWPGTVAVMSYWFGSSHRGSVMGIWCVASSVGDVIGQYTAGALEEWNYSWEWILIVAVVYMIISSFIFGFVHDKPSMVFSNPEESNTDMNNTEPAQVVGIFEAFKIPGVMIYSLNYGCVKLLVYGLLMWLPFYMDNYLHISGYELGLLVSLFGIGGVIGSILIGFIIDRVTKRVHIEASLLVLTIPVLVAFRFITPETYVYYYALVPISGFLLNSVSNIVTSVAPAEISEQETLRSSRTVVGTVVGVIDGAGGIGAALGQPVIGYLAAISWDYTFAFLVMITGLAVAVLVPLFKTSKEVTQLTTPLL